MLGLWFARLRLEEDETIRWQSSAGRSLGRWVTSGGRLVVTNRRVIFQSNRFDSATGKKQWECPLGSVRGFESAGRDLAAALGGGMRKRLEIQVSDGVELFVVNDLEKKVPELRELVSKT